MQRALLAEPGMYTLEYDEHLLTYLRQAKCRPLEAPPPFLHAVYFRDKRDKHEPDPAPGRGIGTIVLSIPC